MKKHISFLLLPFIIFTSVLYSQQKETEALKLLSEVKLIYGNPCEVGVYSGLIERLGAYKEFYPVSDYLAQFNRLAALIEGEGMKLATLPASNKMGLNDDQYLIKMDRFHGREKNIINALGVYYGKLNKAVVNRALNVNNARAWINDIKNYYQESFLFYDIERSLLNDLYSVPGEWYQSEYLSELPK